MPTINQLQKNPRCGKTRPSTRPALQKCPQKKGIIIKVFNRTPKKPNSAIRKVCRLRLSNRLKVLSYIPGEGHNLQEYSSVLIRGGRVKDLPGLKYHLVRGIYDFIPLIKRRNARSKVGLKKSFVKK
jgi:small subunit ribosomal protein S12